MDLFLNAFLTLLYKVLQIVFHLRSHYHSTGHQIVCALYSSFHFPKVVLNQAAGYIFVCLLSMIILFSKFIKLFFLKTSFSFFYVLIDHLTLIFIKEILLPASKCLPSSPARCCCKIRFLYLFIFFDP